MKAYIASSWSNEEQGKVVSLCRGLGIDTYDFKSPPNGEPFSWKATAYPGVNYKEWTLQQYLEALRHPRAVEGFHSDMDALKECDICILVFPAGVSASLEFGFAVGAGKQTAVVGMPREADLMVKMADFYAPSMNALEEFLVRRLRAACHIARNFAPVGEQHERRTPEVKP